MNWKRYGQKLRRIILLHSGIIFFWFHYGRNRHPRFSWFLDLWDPWDPLFVELDMPITLKKYKKIPGTIFWNLFLWKGGFWKFEIREIFESRILQFGSPQTGKSENRKGPKSESSKLEIFRVEDDGKLKIPNSDISKIEHLRIEDSGIRKLSKLGISKTENPQSGSRADL